MAARLTPDPEGGAMKGGRAAEEPGRGVEHALRVLEYDRILEELAERAVTEVGSARVRNLRPSLEHQTALESLRRTEEMMAWVAGEAGWTPPDVPDIREAARRLAVEGSVLEAAELRRIAELLASARRARAELLTSPRSVPRLASLVEDLPEEREIEERFRVSFDESGAVADGASGRLRAIRRELRGRRVALVERLERLAGELPESWRVSDASVTLRNGRYCLPIRREGGHRVGGIVHDESSSRQTLFVEPPQAIQAMNRIRELELEEAREVHRILAELTNLVRPLACDLECAVERLAELDATHAVARWALEHGGSPPVLEVAQERGPYRVVHGCHPLLAAADPPAVPFSLELGEEETVLLVSGPNAGGKTVFLKTVGLLSALAQSGIVPPVGEGTQLPFFQRLFAVIGDEQSIDASLSTFTAHLENLRTILEEADETSLVLVDELGSHTDPAEGAALASAVLRRLAGRVGLCVATTHLGALKGLAAEDRRIVNASLQFDGERLRPTYQVVRDRPGRSYALEIARRIGLPEDLLEEAGRRLTDEERRLESLLREVERRESEWRRLVEEVERRQAELDARIEELREREKELAAREEWLRRRESRAEREARRRVERYLLEARELVESAIARLEERYAVPESSAAASETGSPTGGEPRREDLDRRAAKREARRAVEMALREARVPAPGGERERVRPSPLEVGDLVRVVSLGRAGRVAELRGTQVVVEMRGVRVTVPETDVERGQPPLPRIAEGDSHGRKPEIREGEQGAGQVVRRPRIDPRPEVDLRGLRVEEVEGVLAPAIDAAIVGDLPRLRIIHGKGTGALRERVRQILGADPRVPCFRTGAFSEGGSGVTIVEFEHPDG